MSKLTPLLETLFMNKGGSPDLWKAIAKVVNSKPEEAKYFVGFIKIKLIELNQDVQLLALDVLDFIMVEGKIPIWTQVAAKAFLTSLINILKTRDAPEVQAKILYLIKKWGVKFESYKEILPNFSEIYNGLRTSGVVFPDSIDSDYHKYLGEEKEEIQDISNPNSKYVQNNYNDDFGVVNHNIHDYESNTNSKLDINPNNYDKKYHKLLTKVKVWVENINLANEMIDNTPLSSPVDDGLKSVIDSLREAENENIIYIQEKVKNEKLLELLLGINDDINRTMVRYDCIRSRKKPQPFTSVFGGTKNTQNYSTGKKESVENTNKRTNENLFDLFGNDSNQGSNNGNRGSIVNSNSNTNFNQPIKHVDELFDIFNSKPQPVNVNNTNINNNNSNNMSSPFDFGLGNSSSVPNSNNNQVIQGNNMGFFDITGTSSSSNGVSHQNQQSQQSEKKTDIMDKLKSAYGGGDMPLKSASVDFTAMNQKPNTGMNMGMNPNLNMGMNPNMNMGMNPNMNMGMGIPQNIGMGMNMGMNPNMNMGMNPNMNMGMNPNMNMGMGINPNMNMGMGINQYPNLNTNMSVQMNRPMNMNLNQQPPQGAPNQKFDFNF